MNCTPNPKDVVMWILHHFFETTRNEVMADMSLLTHLAALTQSFSNPKFRELNWKLRRADRNVLMPLNVKEARKPKSKKLLHIERPRARYVCTVAAAENCGLKSHIFAATIA